MIKRQRVVKDWILDVTQIGKVVHSAAIEVEPGVFDHSSLGKA
jgi:hypothetical protein